MQSLQRKIVKWLALILLLFVAAGIKAQTGNVVTLKNILDGNAQQIVPNAVVTVSDDVYFDPGVISKLDTPYQVRNIVTFKINEFSGVYLRMQFSATARVRIIYTKPDYTIDSVEKDLSINYSALNNYTNRRSFVFSNAHKVTVKVLSLTTDASANVTKAFQLENEMQVRPVYKLSCTDDAVKSISNFSVPGDDSIDELPVTWPAMVGADVYDLEWAYVDSAFYKTNPYGDPLNPELLFRNNASRVTIKNNAYQIPMLYDNGGILFFRVRGVQEISREQRLETAWSSAFSGGLGSFGFKGHQRKLNWQSTISYAEEGKRGATVKYYDGTLRNRQTVSKDNIVFRTVVGETLYDYQGRPVIKVLPAPTLNSVIKYTPKFNANISNTEYDKSYYDKLTSPTTYLTASASPMSQTSGANQFYSRNNTDKSGVNQYIPVADGYAFAETAYTLDNTGRISREGNVGAVYRLGSNHENRYYYGIPGESDLDVLFGTEAGERSHYFKNMTQDANGQYSVSYIDMYGRTVATALAGTPDSANLDNLTSNTSFAVTDTLSRANSNMIKDLVMENTQSQLVVIDGNYQFRYALTPPVLQKKDCNNNTVCYNALYDLEIKITDDAYNQRLGGKPFDTIISNYTSAIVADCKATQPFDVSFMLSLPKGSYEITKRLTVRRDGMDYYRDSVFMKKNLCKTLEEFVQEQRDLLKNMPCAPDCASCQSSLGSWETFRTKYMEAAAIRPSDTAAFRGEAWAAWQEAVAACDALCNKTTEVTDIRNAMLLDMSAPSGQYANPDDSLNIYTVFYQKDETALPLYKQENIVYLDEAGKPDLVYDEFSNSYVTPQRLRPDQFSAKFKASWAEALLQFHPEYCKLLEFQQHQASYSWDRLLEGTDTYAEAKAKGYMNPTGNSNYPFPVLAAGKDPLAGESAALQAAIEAKLNNYNGGSGANILSLWSVATVTLKCPGSVSTCTATYNTPAAAFNESTLCKGDLDMAWRNFRQLYLSVKQNIVSDRIKNAACPSGIRNPTSAELIAAGRQLNFTNTADALSQNGLGYLNNNPAAGPVTDSVNRALERSYAENCNAYAKAWVQQLAPCKYSATVLNNIIIPRLVQVCKEGSDATHPLGASSVKPSSTNTYRSFQEVIDQYNAQNGINNPTECNGYMITNPAPYDKQVPYSNKPVYTKPAACECEKLNNLRNEYLAKGKPTDGSFAGYLARTRQMTMSDADLTQLLNACNTNGSCTYFEKMISLPPALQCDVAETCVSCSVVETNYQNFLKAYPGITPLKEEPDTFQLKKNRLFANYMNNKLGFSKQAWEYLVFRDSCSASVVPTPDPDLCTQLKWIQSQYSLNTGMPTGDDSVVVNDMLNGTVGRHILSTSGTTAYASTDAFAAAVWRDSNNQLFKLRDNVVFDFPVRFMTEKINLIYGVMRFGIKTNGPSKDIPITLPNHLSSNGTMFGYVERALGPVVPGVTTFSTLPAVTTNNRLTLDRIPAGGSDRSQNITCTPILVDMFQEYLKNGSNYGVIMRLDDATEAGVNNNLFLFNFDDENKVTGQTVDIQFAYKTSICDRWEAVFNYYFPTVSGDNKHYSVHQIDSIYLINCGVVAGYCKSAQPPPTTGDPNNPGNPADGTLLLCGRATPLFPSVDVNAINNCSDNEFFAVSKGTELFKAYRDSIKGSFNEDYLANGLSAADKELFTVSYNNSEYHYTLFYYDQAGNLVKTVPPAGVKIDRSSDWLNRVRAARAKGQQLVPAHTKITQYRYNTLNQLVELQTPDEGTQHFWYDRIGRSVASQDARQAALRKYRYNVYDALSRIIETGELTSVNPITDNISRDATLLQQWLSGGGSSRVEVTRVAYDVAYTPLNQLVLSARNLRNRVSWRGLYNNANNLALGNYSAASFYSYDIHGNVDTLLQDYKNGALADAGNRFKKFVYRYDLISGKTNHVAYQPLQADAFYHRFTYDGENRLMNVETSRDSVYWENEASYQYYRQGPLARMVLGQQQVQGLDYAYTLQGKLKGVNSSAISSLLDMGRDGLAGSQVALDAMAYALYYYGAREYYSINSVKPFAFIEGAGFKPLFNGNIAASSQHVPSVGESFLTLHSYDVLDRITGSQVVRGLNSTNNTWTPVVLQDFKEKISYDEDGNILTYARNGNNTFAAKPLSMDQLTYNYQTGNNRLSFVSDTVRASNYDNDIDNQAAGNYDYDNIGNLTKDNAAGISNITWTIYGKIASITKTDGTVIRYTYDVSGNRISKSVNGIQTWYVRDAVGNIVSIYSKGDNTLNSGNLTQVEAYLYGTERLGVSLLKSDLQNIIPPQTTALNGLSTGVDMSFSRGNKFFELSNHLFNVLATVSDKKKAISLDSISVNRYEPDIVSAQEYYPFGMGMPGRSLNRSKYRFGFNGKENDNEVMGEDGQQDYGMRFYEPRLGRFLSIDPLAGSYPELTPYQFASNTPVKAIDLDGAETVEEPSLGAYIWLGLTGENHILRAKHFAVMHDIDQSYLFVVDGARIWDGPGRQEQIEDREAHRTSNSSVIIYHPVTDENGETHVYKHVFREKGDGEGKDWQWQGKHNDDLWQEWNLDFDFLGNPIPNEEDRSLPVIYVDLPQFSVGRAGRAARGLRAGAAMMATGGRRISSLYPILKGPLHHLATNKNFVRAMQWSKKFEPIFKKAGYTLDDAINKVYVPGHRGPHPEKYHQYIYDALVNATKGLSGSAYKKAFEKTLGRLAKEAQTKGSALNKLLTGQ